MLFSLLFVCAVYILGFQTTEVSSTSAWCPDRCGGNGFCDKRGRCECFPGFIGADCSQRICPSSIAWFDFPTRNNTAHAPFTECSNMGSCDRTTGLCKCRAGFSGAACDRLDCPMGQTPYSKANFIPESKVCSGNGRCVSLHELSVYEDFTEYFGNEEYVGWDADKIYGCLCDEGWEGPRCDQKSCPKGVDPDKFHTVTPVYETQYLECQCDICQGGIYLLLDNQATAFIPFDATAPVVKQQLELFRGINIVETVLIQGDGICSKEGSVLRIQFLSPRGPQNRLKVYREEGLSGRYITIRAKGQEVKLMYRGAESVASTDVLETCSGRGLCDASTGTCLCQSGYDSSDGNGYPGTKGDCGYRTRALNPYTYTTNGDTYVVSSFCPIDATGKVCHGHGDCFEAMGRCNCHAGYQGFDCSEKQCPSDYAWFGLVGQSHTELVMECSGVGDCDRVTGTCTCVHSAFGGAACEKLTCGRDPVTGLECGGQGVCLPMWHLARFAYNPQKELARIAYEDAWDAGKIHGCLCDRAISVDGQYDMTYLHLSPFTKQSSFFNASIGSNDSFNNAQLTTTALLTNMDFARFQRSPYAKAATDFIGYICTEKKCPTGDVPMQLYDRAADDQLHLNEIQELKCRANNGTFTLTFRENTTLPISFNATASELEYRLEQLFTIGQVAVTIQGEIFAQYGNESTVCSSDRNTSVLIEFLTEHGDLPSLRADVSYLDMNGEYWFASTYDGNFLLNITEYQRGTTMEVECSGAGICDYQTGRCRCMEGFFSSNGSVFGQGEYGDCSYFHPFYTTEALVHPTHWKKTRRGLDTNA